MLKRVLIPFAVLLGSCAPRGLDIGSQACLDQCGVGCAAPGAVCYSDGKDHCNACVASCQGASVVACPSADAGSDAGVDGGLNGCLAQCAPGCVAPGSVCFSDGRSYCNPCVAQCHGAFLLSCAPHPGVDGGPNACAAQCGIGCASPGSLCFSDGRTYCNTCAAQCYGAQPVSCAPHPGVDGGPTACAAQCGVGCAAPGSLCFSDGKTYCNPCMAQCYGAVPVPCPPDAGTDGGLSTCVAQCGTGCAAPGSVCFSDGQTYCNACVGTCHGAYVVGCSPRPADAGP